MRDQSHHIVSYELVSLEDAAEMEALVEATGDAEVIASYPYTVPLEPITEEIEALEDPDITTNPEARVTALDHLGMMAALEMLPERQRQILCEKAGLNKSGTPKTSEEIAQSLGVAVNTVSSALTRARNKLREVADISEIISGEQIPNGTGNGDIRHAA